MQFNIQLAEPLHQRGVPLAGLHELPLVNHSIRVCVHLGKHDVRLHTVRGPVAQHLADSCDHPAEDGDGDILQVI